ncbi:MAG: ABC transporter ATP-binding protein [Phycisphaerae bacterium]|nr:ABC transporter ATP-binding protein [Phycisphaerae bacterium]
MGRVRVPVLRGVSLDVQRGEFVAILGASGSGKSTLLHLLGGLDRVDRGKGRVEYRGRDLSTLSSGEQDGYRSRAVGFVFQFYHLLPELSVLENVLVAAMVRWGRWGYRSRRAELRARAGDLLGAFGLGHRLTHRPGELSGGERQRVAIARALVNGPDVLLADEPTGNLDRKTGGEILDVMLGHRAEQRGTLVMVTHDPEVAAKADRIVRLLDGKVVGAAGAA